MLDGGGFEEDWPIVKERELGGAARSDNLSNGQLSPEGKDDENSKIAQGGTTKLSSLSH